MMQIDMAPERLGAKNRIQRARANGNASALPSLQANDRDKLQVADSFRTNTRRNARFGDRYWRITRLLRSST